MPPKYRDKPRKRNRWFKETLNLTQERGELHAQDDGDRDVQADSYTEGKG